MGRLGGVYDGDIVGREPSLVSWNYSGLTVMRVGSPMLACTLFTKAMMWPFKG